MGDMWGGGGGGVISNWARFLTVAIAGMRERR
jgi:hypothetical protein